MVTQFAPLAAFSGGLLIGLAAVLLMLLHGRILGATGILSGALMPTSTREWAWRVVFLLGMFSAPWLYRSLAGGFPEVQVPASDLLLIVGGLLVGIGVTLGSGCTSGHGVCGLSRGSRRSLLAVVLFMGSAMVTVFVLRHVLAVGS